MVSSLAIDYKLLQNRLSSQVENETSLCLAELDQVLECLQPSDSFSEEQKSQFLSHLPGIITTLLTKAKFNEESLTRVIEFLSKVVSSMQWNLSSSKYLETLRNIIELDKPLYQNYLQDLRIDS